MKNIYGVFGAGGYGREVMPMARAQVEKDGGDLSQLFFVVDEGRLDSALVNGVPVITLKDFLKMDAGVRWFNVAISNSHIREALRDSFECGEVRDWTVSASNCVIMDGVKIGDGSVLSPFVTITSNVTVGVSFHANLYSYVAHDCIIGDYVTFAPGVKCNGNVVVEDHVYVGAGAIIRPGEAGKPLTIGARSVIGMGAVVTKNVPAGSTVFGNPARVIKGDL